MESQTVQNPRAALMEIHHALEPADRKARLVAGILTSVLYVLFAVLIWRSFLTVPVSSAPNEIVAKLVADVADKKAVPPPPQPHLVRPRVETIAPPDFKIASAAPVAPAFLPASAATTSPMAGGAPTGTGTDRGTAGQAPSAIASKGNAQAACLDPVWLHAVTRRVMHFIRLPSDGLRGHVIVHFVVRGSGQLDLVEVSRSSGHQALDDAAYHAMRAANPLPPIPDSMHTDRVDEQYEMDFGVGPLGPRTFKLCES